MTTQTKTSPINPGRFNSAFRASLCRDSAWQSRCHYVKARVRVHRYMDGCMAVFHGPRKLAEYDKKGGLKTAP